MGHFRIFVFLSLYGNRETARFPILFFSFQNENPLAAKYTDRGPPLLSSVRFALVEVSRGSG